MIARALLPLFVAALLAPRVAEACSPIECNAAQVAPADGKSIPANGLLIVVPGSDVDTGLVWPALTLRDDAGLIVPASFVAYTSVAGTWRIYRPAPLVVGKTYSLEWEESCPPSSRKTSFVVTPAAPFATGPLTLGKNVSAEKVIAVGASTCTVDTLAATAELAFGAPDPWAALTSFATRVDGSLWSVSAPGALAASSVFRRVDHLYAACAPPPGANPGLSQGTHLVEVVAEVPTFFTTPAASTTVDLRCAAGLVDATPDTSTDAGTDAAATPPPAGSGSCSVSSMAAGRSTLDFPLLAGSLPLLHLRRRPRRRPSR